MKRRKNDLPKLKRDLKNLETFFKRLPDIVATDYLGFVAENFEAEAWEGQAWPMRTPPKPAPNGKKKRKEKRRALLVKTGRLKRSIRYRIERRGDKRVVIVFSDVPYAQAHNEGAHNEGLSAQVSVKVRAHNRRTKKGKVKVQAHQRKQTIAIPKRQFMGDSSSFNKRIFNYITKALTTLS